MAQHQQGSGLGSDSDLDLGSGSGLGSGFNVGGSGSLDRGLLSCSVSFIALKISVIKSFAAATAVTASENSGLFKILIPLA